MYIIEPMFWLKFLLVLVLISFLIYVFSYVMRKYLKVEKKSSFISIPVNDKHKKIDGIIRMSSIIILLISYFYQIKTNYEGVWYLQIWFILLVSTVISQIVRAFMEWKYSENRKEYILTISQLIFMLILFFIIVKTNGFNLF